MKIEIINDNKLLIYISKEYIKDLNLYEKEKLELYFRNLFVRLKEKYELDIFGYYDITVYRDYNYGGIILLEKDDSDYFNYYGKQIDMCIKIDSSDLFLYMIDNIGIINTSIVDKIKLYKYKDKIYLRIIDNIDSYQMGQLIGSSLASIPPVSIK
jgi:hypothetical protein